MVSVARMIPTVLGAALATACALATAQPISVKVQRQGELVVIDVEATAAVAPAVAWAVLTDYDQMPRYMTALKSSRMTRTGPNTLEVEQVAQAKVAFVNVTLHSHRAVELVPMKEVRSRLISGDFKSYEFTTRIQDKGNSTLITHHGEYVPKSWLPPMIGPAVIQSQTERQYEEIIAEMLRRQGGSEASMPADRHRRDDNASGR